MSLTTVFALVFGDIADKVKNRPSHPFDRVTIGFDEAVPDAKSCRIYDRDGNAFRLTIEPITPSRS